MVTTAVGTLLPLLLLAGLGLFALRRGTKPNEMLSLGKTRARVFDADRPHITFDHVAGVDEAKQELREVVEFLKYPERFTSLGAPRPGRSVSGTDWALSGCLKRSRTLARCCWNGSSLERCWLKSPTATRRCGGLPCTGPVVAARAPGARTPSTRRLVRGIRPESRRARPWLQQLSKDPVSAGGRTTTRPAASTESDDR